MTVLGRLLLPSRGGVPPIAALLAVIGQHEGRDSLATLAEHLENEARERVSAVQSTMNTSAFNAAHAMADAYCDAADMLRRGRVEP
jgi:hypothetical protein